MAKGLLRIFNKKTLKFIWLTYALISMVIFFFFVDNLITKDLDEETDKLLLNENWNITINDKYYENADLTKLTFDSVKKGTDITMTTTLPDNWEFEVPAICLHIRQTTVKIYIDDQLIYEYGEERASQGKTVGSGYDLINFSNDYKGKELKIVLHVAENHAFSKFDSIWLSEWSDSYRFIITENRLPFFTGTFLVTFGVIVSFIFIFGIAISRKYANILLLSVFSICMGLWTLCYHNVMSIFSISLYANTLIEYMFLTLAPLPIIGYMNIYVKQLNSKKVTLTYRLLFAAQIILTVGTIYMHTADIVHSAQMLPFFHVLFTILCFFFTYIIIRVAKLNRQKKRMYIGGLALVIFCIIYEIISYILNRYLGIEFFTIKGISSIGIINFVVLLILDLYQDITQKMMEEQEKALLIRRAYTDDLTQINNRGFCSEYMAKLQANPASKYTVISMDLNDLKKTNDKYGHSKGDLLIQKAAETISGAFSGTGIVGRMGGDEFIAILETDEESQIELLLSTLKKLIDATNIITPDLNLSISYGYATCNEVIDRNIEKVYQLADKRMYEYKRNSKTK